MSGLKKTKHNHFMILHQNIKSTVTWTRN